MDKKPEERLTGALIRPTTPADAPAVAQLMYLAGKSHVQRSIYELMFPEDMEEILRKLAALFTAATPSFYHYSHYLVSEVDGEVAGCLCGYNEREAGGRKLAEALSEIGIDKEEGRAMYRRMLPFHRVNPRHFEDSWVVEHVAVFPEFRRLGIVSSLLEEVLRQGRERGYRSAELNMLIGNEPALGAYIKAGFVIVEERTDEEFMRIFGSPGMARLLL